MGINERVKMKIKVPVGAGADLWFPGQTGHM